LLDYNLTQRERQLLILLLELSKHSKDHFEAKILQPTAADGPARELARLDFGGEGLSMELTKRDLRVLKDEGFIHFRWNNPDAGTGRLSSLAFEVVNSGFQTENAGDAAALAEAAGKRAVIADQKAIALRFEKITAQLVNLADQLIDADESLAANREALSIAEELGKELPDETITIRKIKGFVSRLSLTFSGTADLAQKGELIGEFAERLAAWLVALSVWTEWHAAHHIRADDPCA
jgi:hypothetical protein